MISISPISTNNLLSTNEKKEKNLEILFKKQKINLLAYILSYLCKEEVLIISGLNNHLFTYIKKTLKTDIFALIKANYISKINKVHLSIECLKEVTKDIISNENFDIETVYDYISMYLSKYVIKKNFFLSYDAQKNVSFLINAIDNTQFNYSDNFPLSLTLEEDTFSRVFSQNLRDCNFNFIIKSLGTNLNFLKFLTVINFSNNELEDEVLYYLMDLVGEKSYNLEVLNLSKNNFGKTDSSIKFLQCIKNNKTLKNIDISENKFDHNSIQSLIDIYYSPNNIIENLNATSNEFDLQSIVKLHQFEYKKSSKIMKISFKNSPIYIIHKGKHKILLNEFCRIYNDRYFIEYFESIKIQNIEISNAFSSEQNFEFLMDKIFLHHSSNLSKLSLDFDSTSECIKGYLESNLAEKLKLLNNPIKLCLKNDKNINEYCVPVKKDKFLYIQNINIKNILRKIVDVKLNKLSLKNIAIDSEFIRIVKNILLLNAMNKIGISNCKPISNYDCTFLYAGMRFTQIKEILIKHCEVGSEGEKYFKKSLEKNDSIKILNIIN